MKNDCASDCAPAVVPGWDPIWEKTFREQEWGKYPPEFVIRFVARNFYAAVDRRQVRMLDLGCGPGACTWYMARKSFDVSGVDGSPTAITRAARLAGEGLHADLRVGDFALLPWPDGYFNGVVDNAALYATPLASAAEDRLRSGSRLEARRPFPFDQLHRSDLGLWHGTGSRTGRVRLREPRTGRGKGFCRFLGRPQLDEFYRPLAIVSLETSSYSLEE